MAKTIEFVTLLWPDGTEQEASLYNCTLKDDVLEVMVDYENGEESFFYERGADGLWYEVNDCQTPIKIIHKKFVEAEF